jgi:hypothetical protein
MLTSYTPAQTAEIEKNAYQAGLAVGEALEQARIIDLLQSEKELSSGFSQVNAQLDDLIRLIQEGD